MNQNQFYKVIIVSLVYFLIGINLIHAKIHSPRGEESKIKLKINNKERTYYKLDKSGLNYKNVGKHVEVGDSIRIGIHSRTNKAQTGKKIRNYGFSVQIGDDKSQVIRYRKEAGDVVSNDRPGWVYTKSGIWYLYLPAKKNGYKIIINPLKGNPAGTYIRISSNQLGKKEGSLKLLKTVNSKNSWRITTEGIPKPTLWYPVEINSQQQFEIVGPTAVKVFTRAGFKKNDINKDYYLRIRQDGFDMGNFYFQTEKSDQSFVTKTNGNVGKWRSIWLNIPKGKHYYTFTLPEVKDNAKNTVFIRIKEWSEKK